MRGATECARRLKTLFSSLRAKLGKLSPPAAGDPITQLIVGILSRDVPESKAREALDRIRSVVVDYNELRVIPAIELAEMLGEYPDVRLKCEDISRALNKVFALRHAVTLDDVVDMPRKEARALLEQLDGLEAYSRARIRLLGLQQHAIPLDEAMWAYACKEGIVDPRCSLEEAQSFLERRISEEEALEFVALLNRQAWSEMGAAVRRGECARIMSIPPDRTARNMLQAVGALAEQQRASDAEAERTSQRRAAAATPTARRQRVTTRVVKVRQPKSAAGSPEDGAPPAEKCKTRSSSTKRQATAKPARRARKSPASPSAAQPEAKSKSGDKGARRRSAKGKSGPRAASAKRVAKRKASTE